MQEYKICVGYKKLVINKYNSTCSTSIINDKRFLNKYERIKLEVDSAKEM